MSRESELKEMESRLDEFSEHLVRVQSEIASHAGWEDEDDERLHGFRKEHEDLRSQIRSADESSWMRMKNTFTDDFDGLRSRFESWVRSVDLKYQR